MNLCFLFYGIYSLYALCIKKIEAIDLHCNETKSFQACFQGDFYSFCKNIKNEYNTFSNLNQEEMSWFKCLMTNLLLKKRNYEDLNEIIKITQLNNEENKAILRNISNYQSFFIKEIYNRAFEYDEFKPSSNKNEFFKLSKLNSKYCGVEYLKINENCEKDINCNYKIEFINLNEYTSQSCYLKIYFRFRNCKEFSYFSENSANYSAKFNLANKLLEKNSLKRFEDLNKCHNMFSHQRYLSSKACENTQYSYNKKNSNIISYQYHFNLYVSLFVMCCFAKIYNQICHAGNSASFNDPRLSDVMFITNDILHTIYTAIPLLFHHYKCKEENTTNSSRYDEYVFTFFSAYILFTFAFIIVIRIMIIEKNEIKVWIKFIKLCFFSILVCLVIKEYALMVIFKLGVSNCLLIMSFLCNILSKKTVTEFWFTFLIKLILDILTHIALITSYHCDLLSKGDFIKYFSYFSSYMFTQNSRNIIESVIVNLQSIFIQITMICILLLQKKYGSLFFLPSCFRTKKYEDMKRDIRKTSHTEIERCCIFCTNPLWKIELFYAKDSDKLLKETSSNIFYETKCGLVYHRKCFYESLISIPNCPHCDIKIPIDGWDD